MQQKRCISSMSRVTLRGEPVEVDFIECRPDNCARKVISVRTYPLLSLQGTLSGAVLVLRDDTQAADLERELKEHRYSLGRIAEYCEVMACGTRHYKQMPDQVTVSQARIGREKSHTYSVSHATCDQP